jgi:hypothetical protein
MRSCIVVSGCRAPRGARSQDALVTLGLQLGLARLQGLGNGATGAPDALAGLRAGRRRQSADLPVGQRERGPVPGVREADLLQLVQAAGGGDGLERLVAEPVQLGRL